MDWEKERKIIDRVLAHQNAKQSAQKVERSISRAWEKYIIIEEAKGRYLATLECIRKERIMVSPAYKRKDRWQ